MYSDEIFVRDLNSQNIASKIVYFYDIDIIKYKTALALNYSYTNHQFIEGNN